jgi:hypothetical protein
VRIDWSDPSDGSRDDPAARRAQSTLDQSDDGGKSSDTLVGSDGPPDSGLAGNGSALRTERAAAYRAKVDAVYRQYAMERPPRL